MSMQPPRSPLGPQRPAAKMSDTTMMLIVFVGAAIGGFFVWPIIRPMFIPNGDRAYQQMYRSIDDARRQGNGSGRGDFDQQGGYQGGRGSGRGDFDQQGGYQGRRGYGR